MQLDNFMLSILVVINPLSIFVHEGPKVTESQLQLGVSDTTHKVLSYRTEVK